MSTSGGGAGREGAITGGSTRVTQGEACACAQQHQMAKAQTIRASRGSQHVDLMMTADGGRGAQAAAQVGRYNTFTYCNGLATFKRHQLSHFGVTAAAATIAAST